MLTNALPCPTLCLLTAFAVGPLRSRSGFFLLSVVTKGSKSTLLFCAPSVRGGFFVCKFYGLTVLRDTNKKITHTLGALLLTTHYLLLRSTTRGRPYASVDHTGSTLRVGAGNSLNCGFAIKADFATPSANINFTDTASRVPTVINSRGAKSKIKQQTPRA